MRPILRFSDIDEIVTKNTKVFQQIKPDHLVHLSRSTFLSLSIEDIGRSIPKRVYWFDEDPSGKETIVIKKFETQKEMLEFCETLNKEEFEKEITDKYGPGNCIASFENCWIEFTPVKD